MIRDLPLYLRARAVWLAGVVVLAWARRCDGWAAAATDRADSLLARTRILAERLNRIRAARRTLAAGDLLYGSRAIAAHLGLPKATVRHLIRAKLIPWFSLGGVACTRRSSLAGHFAELEAQATGDARPRGGPSRDRA